MNLGSEYARAVIAMFDSFFSSVVWLLTQPWFIPLLAALGLLGNFLINLAKGIFTLYQLTQSKPKKRKHSCSCKKKK